MPQYTFECTDEACQAQIDVVQSYKDASPHCPECNGPTKCVIVSAPAVSLKGSGWAHDGYSTTDMGAQVKSDKADRGSKVVSFAGQKNRGREGT